MAKESIFPGGVLCGIVVDHTVIMDSFERDGTKQQVMKLLIKTKPAGKVITVNGEEKMEAFTEERHLKPITVVQKVFFSDESIGMLERVLEAMGWQEIGIEDLVEMCDATPTKYENTVLFFVNDPNKYGDNFFPRLPNRHERPAPEHVSAFAQLQAERKARMSSGGAAKAPVVGVPSAKTPAGPARMPTNGNTRPAAKAQNTVTNLPGNRTVQGNTPAEVAAAIRGGDPTHDPSHYITEADLPS